MTYLRQDGVYHFKNYASHHCYHFTEGGEVCGFGLGQLKLEDIRTRLQARDYVCGTYTLEEDRIIIQFPGGPKISGRITENRLLLQVRWDENTSHAESREYDFFVMPESTPRAAASVSETTGKTKELSDADATQPAKTAPLSETVTAAAITAETPSAPGKTKPLIEPAGAGAATGSASEADSSTADKPAVQH